MKNEAFEPVGGLNQGLMLIAAHGIHPLFDSASIRRAFSRIGRGAIQEGAVLAAHSALREIGTLGTVDEMVRYLRLLPATTLDVVIFVYFRSLDQYIQQQDEVVWH